MNYCSKCGKPLAEGSTFCFGCGAAAEIPPEVIPGGSENNAEAKKKFNLSSMKIDVFSTDEPLKPKIIFFLILIGLILWGWLGEIIEKVFGITLPSAIALVFVIPAIVSVVVQGIITFILCWNFLKNRIVFLIPALFLSLFGCCLFFIFIPILTIRHIITFLVRKSKQRR